MSSGPSAVACRGAGERVAVCRSAPAISKSFTALVRPLAAALIRGAAPYLVVELDVNFGFCDVLRWIGADATAQARSFHGAKKEEQELAIRRMAIPMSQTESVASSVLSECSRCFVKLTSAGSGPVTGLREK